MRETLDVLGKISPVGIWRADRNGMTVYANDKCGEIHGIDALGALSWLDSVHPDDKERVVKFWKDSVESPGRSHLEYRCVRPDGSVVWVLDESVAHFDDAGNANGFIGTVTDITERKIAEGEIKNYAEQLEKLVAERTRDVVDSEKKFRSYFELPLIGIAITSPDKGWIEVNDKLCQIFGYEREELAKMTWAELTYPEDLDADVGHFDRVLKGELEGYSLDKRFIRKDGSIIRASISARCVRLPDGKVDYFVALVQDVTEAKIASLALKASERRLARVTAGSRDIFWEWDIEKNVVWWSPNFYALMGLNENDFVTTYDSFKTLLHPDDVDRVYANIRDDIENGIPYETSYRLKTKSGYRWIFAKGTTTRDERGIPIFFSGALREIGDLSGPAEQF